MITLEKKIALIEAMLKVEDSLQLYIAKDTLLQAKKLWLEPGKQAEAIRLEDSAAEMLAKFFGYS